MSREARILSRSALGAMGVSVEGSSKDLDFRGLGYIEFRGLGV